MSRFETVLCLTLVAATVTVLGFAIVRPPASRPDSQAAPSSASPLRPSSERLLAGLAGTPEQSPSMVSVAMGQQVAPQPASGVPPSQSPPAAEVRVTTASARRVSGLASWYCRPPKSACTRGYPASGLYAAAGATLRVGNWRGRYVYVNGLRVRLVDSCACGSKLLDLYASAFRRLAPLSRGVVRVTVTW